MVTPETERSLGSNAFNGTFAKIRGHTCGCGDSFCLYGAPMDNNININKPGDDKLSKQKKFTTFGLETETSLTGGITSASSTQDDTGSVTRHDINCADTGTVDSGEKIVNKKEEGAIGGRDETGLKADSGSGEEAVAEGRQEEDIEVDDADAPAAGDAVNSFTNNNDSNDNISSEVNQSGIDDSRDERQVEPIEIDLPSAIIAQGQPDSDLQQTNRNLSPVAPPVEHTIPSSESASASDRQEELIEVDETDDLNDLNKKDPETKAAQDANQSKKDPFSNKTETAQGENIGVDESSGTLEIENNSAEETQEYSLKAETDGRQCEIYQDKDFNTDSDLDNVSDSNNQQSVDNTDEEVEETEAAGEEHTTADMGCTIRKKEKDPSLTENASTKEDQKGKKGANGSPQKGKSSAGAAKGPSPQKGKKGPSPAKDKKGASPRKKHKSSSSEEDDERPWQQKKYDRDRPKGLARLKRQWSDHDTLMYRQGYPGKKETKSTYNLQFYQNKIRSDPNGAFIDDIHKTWWDDLDLLESHHGYIQWLFPIRESGMNWHAHELQRHEAEKIHNDKKAFERFVQSYEMMLNFYGLKLVNRETGEVERADNWKQRFRHLNVSTHNYLRITRILKCLGEMGLEHYKAPFLRHMLHEAIVEGTLSRTLESCYNYWIGTLRDDKEREEIRKLAEDLYANYDKD